MEERSEVVKGAFSDERVARNEVRAAGRPGLRPAGTRWIVAFAQEHSADRELHERVSLAFTEALTNAARHAYADVARHHDDIRVSADIDDDTLEIVVVDHGSGFRAASDAAGLGAGLGIIASCADRSRSASTPRKAPSSGCRSTSA